MSAQAAFRVEAVLTDRALVLKQGRCWRWARRKRSFGRGCILIQILAGRSKIVELDMRAQRIRTKLLWPQCQLARIARHSMRLCIRLEESRSSHHKIGERIVERPIIERPLPLLLRIHHLARYEGAARAAVKMFFDRIHGAVPLREGHLAGETDHGVIVSSDAVILGEACCGHVFACMIAAVRPSREGTEALLKGCHRGAEERVCGGEDKGFYSAVSNI